MKKIIEERVTHHIYKEISDTSTSIDDKITILSDFFNRYEGKEIHPSLLPFYKPCAKELKEIIINSYKTDYNWEGTKLEGKIQYIVEIELRKIVDKHFKL